MDLQDILSPEVIDRIARILLAVLAVALIWVLRRVFVWLTKWLLKRLALRMEHPALDDIILAIISIPVRLLVIALAIFVGALFLMPAGTSQFLKTLIQGINGSLIVLAIAMAFYKTVSLIAISTQVLMNITGFEIEEALLPFVRTGLRFVIIALGAVMILQAWDVDVNGLIAGLGIGGLALALAAQDTVANLFGFTTIVGDQPFTVGEYIVTSDVSGIVEHVGLRSTRVRQLDQALVTVPNNVLANAVILNWSRLEKRRIDFKLGVTYETDSAQMRVLLDRIRQMLDVRECVQSDSVVVYFTDFNNSSLDVLIRCYILLSDWAEFTTEREEINLAVMDIIDELGLSIAFPTRSIYIEEPEDRLALPVAPVIETVLDPIRQTTELRDYAPDEASNSESSDSEQGEDD